MVDANHASTRRPGRVRLSEPAAPFSAPMGALTRLTFGLVESGEPVLYGPPTSTVVVVWPCDLRGYVDVAAVLQGRARVTSWAPSDAEIEQLRVLVGEGWTFKDNDLLAGGASKGPRMIPAPRSLRVSPYYPMVERDVLERIAVGGPL